MFIVCTCSPIDYMKDVVDPNDYILLPPGSVSQEATEVRVGIYANSIEIGQCEHLKTYT